MVRNAPSEALPVDTNSPSAKAALSYLAENLNLDSCGQQTKAYIDSILAGNPRGIAAQVATAVYQQNNVAGVPLSPACLAAEVAWKDAVTFGRDPVLPSALASLFRYHLPELSAQVWTRWSSRGAVQDRVWTPRAA